MKTTDEKEVTSKSRKVEEIGKTQESLSQPEEEAANADR